MPSVTGADSVSSQEAKDSEIEQCLLLPLRSPHRELNCRQTQTAKPAPGVEAAVEGYRHIFSDEREIKSDVT